MSCPTNYDRRRRSRRARKKDPSRSPGPSRTNPPPDIYVRVEGQNTWSTKYASAHLRNRKGYVYLTWRDGEKVRSFYLGKAPRKSPTPDIALAPGAGGASDPAARLQRRGKLRASR
jgi:hypothetical protein